MNVCCRTLLALVIVEAALLRPLAPLQQHYPRGRAVALQLVPPDAASGDAASAKQQKPKSQADRFLVEFTCNKCGNRNSHSISRLAYTKGTVIVTCPSCKASHLIADNLNWIEDDFKNIEAFMEKRGTPVTKLQAQNAPEGAVLGSIFEGRDDAPASEDKEASSTGAQHLDGITDGMAARIREAVRANKRKRAQEAMDPGRSAESSDE